MSLEDRVAELEKRVERIEEWCKRLREHPLPLKERFLIHDTMRDLKSRFYELELKIGDEKLRSEIREVVEALGILVDRALGVRWP